MVPAICTLIGFSDFALHVPPEDRSRVAVPCPDSASLWHDTGFATSDYDCLGAVYELPWVAYCISVI